MNNTDHYYYYLFVDDKAFAGSHSLKEIEKLYALIEKMGYYKTLTLEREIMNKYGIHKETLKEIR